MLMVLSNTGAGATEDAGSAVTRTGTFGTGLSRATERAPAPSRPQVNRPGRGGPLVAQQAHEQGADDTRQGERAAKRTQEVHSDALEHRKGCEDKKETVKYVPRGRLGSHVCRKMARTPEPRSSQSPAAEAAPPAQAVQGYAVAGAGWGEGRCSPNAAPFADVLGSIRCVVVTLVSGEPGDSVARGAANGRAEEGKRGLAGTGEGGDKGGQAEARREGAEVVAAGAEGQGEERGDQAVARR